MKSTPALWVQLELAGHQRFPADEYGPAQVLEMRNCPCGSTLCLDVTGSYVDVAAETRA